LHLREAERVLDSRRYGPRFRCKDASAQHGRDLDLDLCTPLLDDETGEAAVALPAFMGAGAHDACLDALLDPQQRGFDGGQRFFTRHDGQESQVDIDRQARHVAHEEIDGGAALEGEVLLFRHGRNGMDQQCDLIPVPLIDRHVIPPAR
jgi:hypothetical protein